MSKLLAPAAGLILAVSFFAVASTATPIDKKKGDPVVVRSYCELCSITIKSDGTRERHCNEVPCPSVRASRFSSNVPVGGLCLIRRSGLPDLTGRVTVNRTCGVRAGADVVAPRPVGRTTN